MRMVWSVPTVGFDVDEVFGATQGQLTVKQLLEEAGFTPKELREAGRTAKDLLDAGVSVRKCRVSGYTAGDLKAAGGCALLLPDPSLAHAAPCPPLLSACAGALGPCRRPPGVPVNDMKRNGFTARELVVDAGFTNAKELRLMGFSFGALKLAGFSDRTLVLEAKFTVSEVLKATGYSAFKLSEAGFRPSELKEAGARHAETRVWLA